LSQNLKTIIIMNKIELKEKLNKMGVIPSEYSLEGSIADWDKIVLYQNYAKWEVFYLDERGNRDSLEIFDNEADACQQIYNEFRRKWKY